jgi:hypothetical protein
MIGDKWEICYACEKPIEERQLPKEIHGQGVGPQFVGKYTIRRQAWDENWKPINTDTYFHEECYYKGFIFAIKHGWLYGEMMKAVDESAKQASYRASGGVDHE